MGSVSETQRWPSTTVSSTSRTAFANERDPDDGVGHLQDLSLAFEAIALKHDVEKIKTIGDCFMVAAGLTMPLKNPVLNCIRCGLEMLKVGRDLASGWNLRIGIHTGPVIAGIVGHQRFSYALGRHGQHSVADRSQRKVWRRQPKRRSVEGGCGKL
jgi:hypothetical protein